MTSTELQRPAELLNPLTGQLIPTNDLQAVTVTLDALRQHRRDVDTAIAAFTEPILEESRRQGKKTLDLDGARVKVSADHEVEWDTQVLLELRDLGLPEERFRELVRTTVVERVDGNVARQVAGASVEYGEVVERAKRKTPKRQYVTVETK